jgi:hypothetical protein
MTTIAMDGKTVAADTLRVSGTEIVDRQTAKIIVREGQTFAFTGDFGVFEPLIAWYLAGADVAQVPKLDGDGSWLLLVPQRDHVWSYSKAMPYGDTFPYPTAWGSGGPYAQGALLAGKTPAEAVAIAMKLDIYTGGEIIEQPIVCHELLTYPEPILEAAE